MPTLSDQYTTGPFDVILTNKATITIGTSNMQDANKAKPKSNILFILGD